MKFRPTLVPTLVMIPIIQFFFFNEEKWNWKHKIWHTHRSLPSFLTFWDRNDIGFQNNVFTFLCDNKILFFFQLKIRAIMALNTTHKYSYAMILIITKRFFQSTVSRLIYFSSVLKHSFSYTLQLMNMYNFITRLKQIIIYVFTDYEIRIH